VKFERGEITYAKGTDGIQGTYRCSKGNLSAIFEGGPARRTEGERNWKEGIQPEKKTRVSCPLKTNAPLVKKKNGTPFMRKKVVPY